MKREREKNIMFNKIIKLLKCETSRPISNYFAMAVLFIQIIYYISSYVFRLSFAQAIYAIKLLLVNLFNVVKSMSACARSSLKSYNNF